MPLPTFDKCCLCVNLKTGCFIIGYFQMVACIMMLTLTLITLIAGGVALDADDQKVQEAGLFLTIVSLVYIVMLSIMLVFVILLLVGLHKSKRAHIKAYLVYATVFFVLGVCSLLGGIISGRVDSRKSFSDTLSLLLGGYFLLIINSYYRQLDQAKTGTYNTA